MPTVSPAASLAAVRARLKDSSINNPTLTEDDVDAAIQSAVKGDYSRHRPRQVVTDITGTGSSYYKLTGTVSGWVDDVSRVEAVEYPALDPASASAGAPEYLEPWEWEIYLKSTDMYLRLKTVQPSASETVRITFTAQHIHLAAGPTDTVFARDLEAVLDLAAALGCAAAIGRTAPAHDGIIKSGVLRDTEQARWEAAYRLWLKRYQNHMGIDTDKGVETSLASVIITPGLQPQPGEFGGQWLTHRRQRLYRR